MSTELGRYTQICFVTRDLERSIRRWMKAGAGPFYTANSETLAGERTYRGAPATDRFRLVLAFFGTTQVELFEPLCTTRSVFRDILERAPSGEADVFHHVQPKVEPTTDESFEAQCRELEAKGFVCIATGTAPNGGKVRFFEDPSDPNACLVELSQKDERAMAVMARMLAAHMDWDGSRPVRDMAELVRAY